MEKLDYYTHLVKSSILDVLYYLERTTDNQQPSCVSILPFYISFSNTIRLHKTVTLSDKTVML